MTTGLTNAPQQTHFDRIGGESAIRQLVDRFYDLMDTEEIPRGIRALHPPDLSESRDKLYWFLVGWMGGPAMYIERFGHPRLRMRHMPFPIGESERDQWLWCMFKAMDELIPDTELREQLAQSLMKTADFMRNREG